MLTTNVLQMLLAVGEGGVENGHVTTLSNRRATWHPVLSAIDMEAGDCLDDPVAIFVAGPVKPD